MAARQVGGPMKGNEKVISVLNTALASEWSAARQYGVHQAMAEQWGLSEFAAYLKEHKKDEQRHARMLMERILFLGGTPDPETMGKIVIGKTPPAQLASDLGAELKAVSDYNAAIAVAAESGDNGTRAVLESILKDEEHHVNEIETNQDQIALMGLPAWLSEQVG